MSSAIRSAVTIIPRLIQTRMKQTIPEKVGYPRKIQKMEQIYHVSKPTCTGVATRAELTRERLLQSLIA
jgi:hypothetical protein